MKRVLLLLCDGVEILEAGAFYDVLGWASEYGTTKIDVVPVGLRPEVSCTFGLKLVPDRLLADVRVDDFDALAIPGGFGEYGFYEEGFTDEVADVIRAFESLDRPIAAICVGALAVASSGVLEGRRATTYHLMGGQRRQQLAEFGAKLVDEPIVRDGNIITSTGPGTAVGVAFELLEDLTDADNVARIRHLMGFDR
jgi:4-methyl-5(b-hydroxyethyl)-thiazole monophosphate biosynthesis